jgi:DNA modification methylase
MIEKNKIYNEPCLETIKRFDDNSIDCVITSPPYWQLRDYGYDGQWGLEPTFQMYLEHLWGMMDELMPKLKKTGTVWINLGDTYMNNSSQAERGRAGLGNDKIGMFNKITEEAPKKSLCLIPHRFAIGCIDRGWIVRNDIIWAKRNGMPESVTDRFSKKHEYFFLMTKSTDYYFDLDGIRDKHKYADDKRNDGKRHSYADNLKVMKTDQVSINAVSFNPIGKNPGSVSDFWDIPTKPSSEEHYASYNDELLKKPIIAGCPKGGLVYDPFMGTGTTAKMCIRTGRDFVGSEMSEVYYNNASKQLNRLLSQTVLF